MSARAGFPRIPGGTEPGPRGGPCAQPNGPGPCSQGTPGTEERSAPGLRRPYARPWSARPPEVAEVQRGGAAGSLGAEQVEGAAPLAPGGTRLETGAKLLQVTLLRGFQGPPSQPCSALRAAAPRPLMVGCGRLSFFLVPELVH